METHHIEGYIRCLFIHKLNFLARNLIEKKTQTLDLNKQEIEKIIITNP